MSTYTITDYDGNELYSGLSAEQSADILLTHDGHAYEIRLGSNPDCWILWHSDASQNSVRGAGRLQETKIFSLHKNAQAAQQEIFLKVIDNAAWFSSLDAILND